MGQVYRARDMKLDRGVAIKVLLAAQSQVLLNWFGELKACVRTT